MDSGIDSILVILCRHYGPFGVSTAPRLNATAPFHGCLLWVSWVDVILFRRRKSPLVLPSKQVTPSMLSLGLAPKHDPHAVCGTYATGLSDLVSGELLPDGQQRVAPRQHLWRPQGRCLDDQLRGPAGRSVGDTCSSCPCTVHRRVKGIFPSAEDLVLPGGQGGHLLILLAGDRDAADKQRSQIRLSDSSRMLGSWPCHHGRRHGPATSNPGSEASRV